jgi:hypothetical protein
MGITAIAFAGTITPSKDTQETMKPLPPTQIDIDQPAGCKEAPLYTGQILSVMEDGSILTQGVHGIEGQVIVHLPEDLEQSFEFSNDAYLTIYYDGNIAESYPVQIWALGVMSVDTAMPEPPLGSEPPVTYPEPADPLPMDEPLFIGIIKEIQGSSVLTDGIFGLEGDVLVHLPEDVDPALEFPEGYLISLTYDGKVARSYPAQIWATNIRAVEENQVISLDPMENPTMIEVPKDTDLTE